MLGGWRCGSYTAQRRRGGGGSTVGWLRRRLVSWQAGLGNVDMRTSSERRSVRFGPVFLVGMGDGDAGLAGGAGWWTRRGTRY